MSLFTVGNNEYETEHAIRSVSNEVRSFVHFTFYYRYYLYPLFCFQYNTLLNDVLFSAFFSPSLATKALPT